MPDDTPPAAESAGDETTQDSDTAATEERTYTGKDLERVVKQRLEREQRKAAKAAETARIEGIAAWREENGIDDAALEKLSEGPGVEANIKRDIRNLKAEATKAKNATSELQTKYAAATLKLRQALVNDVLLREAAGKFVDPQDAVDKLSGRFTYDEDNHEVFVVDDKGEPSGLTAGELIADLLERKPHLAVPSGDAGAGSRVMVPARQTDTSTGEMSATERKAILGKGLA